MQNEGKTNSQNSPSADTGTTAKLVLNTTRKLGLFKAVPCYLVFNEKGMVLAHLSKQVQKEAIKQYRQEQKEQGKGMLGTMMAMAGFWKGYGQRYYSTPKEEILRQDSLNIELPYTGITSFVFKTARRCHDRADQMERNHEGIIKIATPAQKMRFKHDYLDTRKNIKTYLNSVLGTQLKYKAPLLSKTILIGGNPNDID